MDDKRGREAAAFLPPFEMERDIMIEFKEVEKRYPNGYEALRHINRKSVDYHLHTQGDDYLLAQMDARLIVQVVINLVDNAIKYTPVGSVIQISAYRKDHQVVVEVADNGPGIPDRAKAQVFEMFYTGQSRIADSHRSLGLGLPLCRAILTAHGGTLTLRDNIPNGSVFSFALPQSEVNIHE